MSDSKDTQNTTMGDMFRQKRVDKQRQEGGGSFSPTGNANRNTPASDSRSNDNRNAERDNNKKSLVEIQAEQEREQKQKDVATTPNRGSSNGRGMNAQQSGGRNQTSSMGGNRFDRNSNDNDFSKLRDGGRFRNEDNSNNNGNDRNRFNRNNNTAYDRDPTNTRFQSRGRGGGGGGARGRGPSGRGSGRSEEIKSGLPKEQGVICTLRDGFGFIHCADRPEQVFFHFSELKDGLRPGDLKVDDEVEFRIGESTESKKAGTSNSNEGDKKIAALHVNRMPLGQKIIWEYPDESVKYPVNGIIERSARSADVGNSGRGQVGSSLIEGSIRIVSDVNETVGSESVEVTNSATVRYFPDEYDPLRKASGVEDIVPPTDGQKNVSTSSTSRGPMYLSRGDLVEISQIVVDRRTKERYAKRISIIMSDRQRLFQVQEAKLLASAREEVGVITAIKGDYGFLKSNQRHEEIYFHISNMHGADEQADVAERRSSVTLKEGQEMKFLVVTEDEDNMDESAGKNRRRVSARQVQVQPAGSVRWHDVIAKGVTGEVIECPQPIDSGHPLETQGKVRLHVPIRMKKKHQLEELLEKDEGSGTSKEEFDDEDDGAFCTEVYIWSKDSPGGNFPLRGGSSVGLFIQNGDTLLFDVIRDYIGDGGTCRAARTSYLTPREEEQEESHLEPEDEDQDDSDTSKAIRLVDMALAGRAEGFISALKDNAYGFLHFAERPVDVHFKTYQLLPDALQADLRRNMGLPEMVQLDVGAEVHFDLSVHGTILAKHTSAGNSAKKRQQHSNVHERENLKAQRILLLPPGMIKQNFSLAKGVRGKMCKQDITQPYVGSIELDNPIRSMPPEERHPLVFRMIESFLLSPPETTRIIYHDIQSLKEDEVVVEMTELLGKGRLKCSHIPVAGETLYPGLLCIEKVAADLIEVSHTPDMITNTINTPTAPGDEVSVDMISQDDCFSHDGLSGDEADADRADKRRRKKKSASIKVKTVTNVRFDKNSLSLQLRNDMPPSVDDVVIFDVSQQRRTGQVAVENMSMLERHIPEIANTGIEAFGVIKDIMTNLNFGFISVLDKSTHISEILTFNLSDVNKSSGGRNLGKLKKGDSVKFMVGSDAKNGKHVALNVELYDPKQRNKSSLSDSNPCRGLVLLKLTKNIVLKGDKKKEEPSTISSTATISGKTAIPEKKSRWDNVSVTKDIERNRDGITEVGFILLTEDQTGVFDTKFESVKPNDPSSIDSTEPNKQELSSETSEACPPSDSNLVDANDDAERTITISIDKEVSNTMTAVKTHLHFKRSNIAIQNGHDESIFPQRGDLVSFNKIRGSNGARDVRIVERGAAYLVRGKLEGIDLKGGHAKFVILDDSKINDVYDINLKEVLGCETSLLKESEHCEGLLYDNQIYGICRVSDLYIETTKKSTIGLSKPNGASSTERPKLNLTVKKDRGGTIMAQSMMAKGPDEKTKGFYSGWTTRLSAFAPEFTLPGSD